MKKSSMIKKLFVTYSWIYGKLALVRAHSEGLTGNNVLEQNSLFSVGN